MTGSGEDIAAKLHRPPPPLYNPGRGFIDPHSVAMETELEAAMAATTVDAAPVDAQPVPAALVPGGTQDGGMASSATAESLRRAHGAELSDEDATWLADARGRKLLDQSAIVIGE